MPGKKKSDRAIDLQKRIEGLEARLRESEDTLRAIHEGEVDAVIVSGSRGEQVYTLVGSESIYRLIVETMKEAAAVVALNGTVLYCNDQFGQLLNRPVTQILGHPFSEFVAGADIPALSSIFAAARNHTVKQRILFQAAGNPYVPVRISAIALNQPGETSLCIIASDLREFEGSDASQRKRAEQELEDTEHRYRQLVQSSPDAIIVHRQGAFLYANAAALTLFGASGLGKLQEKNLLDFIHPDHRESIREAIQKLEIGEKLPPKEGTLIRLDGQEVQVEVYASRVTYDRSKAIQAIIRDITERKKAETVLRESEQRERRRAAELQTILDTVPIGLSIAEDTTGHHIRGNRANEEMYGLAPGAELAKAGPQAAHFRVFQDGRELSPGELPMQRAIQGEAVTEQFIEVERQDGQRLTVFAKAAPLLDEAGLPRGAVGAFLDITKLKAAEEALRESRAKYQALTETTSDFIWEMDAQGRYTYCSPQMETLWGLKPSDMVGKTPFDLTPADCRDKDVEAFRNLSKSPQPFNGLESLAFDSHGRLIHIEISGVPFFDDAGNLLGFRGITRDITGRKRAEEALAAAHRQIQSIIDNTTSIVYALDLEERFVMVNTALANLLNSTPEQMIGRRRHELMPREDAEWHEANDRQVFEAGRALEFEEYSQIQDRSITWLTTKFPLRDASGNIYAVAGISADISERKKMEERLRDSEERLQLTLRASEVGTFEFDLTTGAGSWNTVEYELLGLKPGDLQAGPETFFRYVHPQDIAQLRAEWDNATRTGVLDVEFRVIRADGQERWLAGKGQFTFAENGNVESPEAKKPSLRFLGVNYDITERKQADEVLRRAKEELELRVQERTKELAIRADQLRALAGELTISEQRERKRLAGLLHDHLQQLLVGAKFRLSVLGKAADETTKLGAREIEELIDESIQSSRSLTAELSPPILHDAGLNAGLEWLGRRMADTQGLFVNLATESIGSLPEDLTILLFESVRELLFNAAKHAETSSASVESHRFNGSLQVIVSDQGVGFDPAALPPAGEAGRGFGLFSIRERLELFGGKLEIESSPGKGSRFVISVPITGVEAQMPAIAELPREVVHKMIPARARGRKIRLLLADDHAIVRQGIANLLRDEADIEIVGEAADGQEAADAAARLLPDVILMDMNMPRLNGVEATRLIHRDFPEIRIIGLSMFEEAEKAQSMRDAGAVNYLTKSGPVGELVEAIRTAVEFSDRTLVQSSKR